MMDDATTLSRARKAHKTLKAGLRAAIQHARTQGLPEPPMIKERRLISQLETLIGVANNRTVATSKDPEGKVRASIGFNINSKYSASPMLPDLMRAQTGERKAEMNGTRIPTALDLENEIIASEHTGSSFTAEGSSNVMAMLYRTDFTDEMGSMFMYDLLDVAAMQVIDYIIASGGTITMLTHMQLWLLYRYFYRTNPIIAQVIDTHTDLLMSKARVDPPANVPEILRDYCVNFFNNWIERSKFSIAIRDAHRKMNIYGYAYIVMDDDTTKLKNELQPLRDITPTNYKLELSEEDEVFVKKIEQQYRDEDPAKIEVIDRMSYLSKKCIFRFESDYYGPDRTLIYSPLELTREYKKRDASYEALFIPNKYANEAPENLREMGLTGGWQQLILDAGSNPELQIDNGTEQTFPFMTVLERPERTSLIHRTLHDALIYELGRRAELVRMQMFGKQGRIYMAPSASLDQLYDLEAQIQSLHEDPTYVVVTNHQITIEEVGQKVSDQAKELMDGEEHAQNTMSTAMGLPMSFISNESQYSGANITLEVINVIYNSQKDHITSVVNETIFKPVAIRKGLVVLDDWGDPRPVYPRLTFTRMALRDDSVTQNLFNLYQKGSLPVEIIYEIFNLDTEDINRALRDNAFTFKDPTFNDLIRGVTDSLAAQIAAAPEIMERICESIGIEVPPAPLAPPGGEGGMPGGDMGGEFPGGGGELPGGLPGEMPGEEGMPPGEGEVPPGEGVNVPDVTTDNFTPT